jgi:hypothetical protein
MTPRSEPSPAFQFVHEHAVFVNRNVKSVNAALFADTFTAWPAFLNHAGKLRAVARLPMNTLSAKALAEGYLWALQLGQDEWA